MVKTCCVWKCTNRATDASLSFHAFPIRNAERRRRWIQAISREGDNGRPWVPTANDRVCSSHFLESDFKTNTKTKTLKPNAVPSIFPQYPAHKNKSAPFVRPSPKKREHKPQIETPASKRLKQSSSAQHDHCYASCSTDIATELAKEKLKTKTLQNKYKASQNCIRALKVKVGRQKKKIDELLADLKQQNLINGEQSDVLLSNLSEESTKLFTSELSLSQTAPTARRYTEEMKAFSVTLHFYSPQAYEFLRKHLILPDESTIRRWASSINCEPGFMKDSLEDMATQLKKDPNRKDICMVFDSMALKKEFVFDQKQGKYTGFIDFGSETTSSDHLATEVLVLMAVGLRTHWKQPFGYFLIDKLSATVQSQLVKDAIIQLTEHGFSVHATVCDGNFTNQKTASLLGCQLSASQLSSSFAHPSVPDDSVYFIFDACHLLKNMRNLIGDCKKIYNADNQLIEWKFIETLNKVQLQDNLHLANKLTSKHVDFVNNKMNVKLAAQTLSSSVADAIDFLREDIKMPEFVGSEATSDFIRTVDKLFDICNSSNLFAKGFKSPINKNNLLFKVHDLQQIGEYLKQLKEASTSRTPLIYGRRKTAVIGFLVTIKSLCGLADRLLNRLPSPFSYVLTYKFSQDHLETFFSRIRRRGGWNNNPNPLQFKHSLQKLMLKNGVKASQKANCQEAERLNEGSILPPLQPQDSTPLADTTSSEVAQFIKLIEKPSLFHDQALYYISGFICRKLIARLDCTTCLSAVVRRVDACPDLQKNPNARLTLRKDRGGLLCSNDIFAIVRTADKILRQLIQTMPLQSLQKTVVLRVQIEACSQLSGQLFRDLDDHTQDTQAPLQDDHRKQIVKIVCEQFTLLVMKHSAKIMTQRFIQNNKGTVRHKMTKAVIFLHQ